MFLQPLEAEQFGADGGAVIPQRQRRLQIEQTGDDHAWARGSFTRDRSRKPVCLVGRDGGRTGGLPD
jgi:hypothetical protein